MDLWDISRLLLRRWFVCVPLLLVTVVVTLQTANYVKPEFTATGSVLLVPPTGKPAPAPAGKPASPGNPWAELGPVAMAQAVTIIHESQNNREAVAAAGWEPGYTLSIVTRSAIVTISSTSKSPAKAKGTVQYVLQALMHEVDAKQKAFEQQPVLKITTETLDSTGTVTTVTTGVRRAQIAISGVGVLVTIVMTIIVDALIKLARRRRELMVRQAVRGVASPQQAAPSPPPAAQPSQITIRDTKRDRSVTSADTMVLRVVGHGDSESTVPLQ